MLEQTKLIVDIVKAIAVSVASVVAVWGINSWKRELVGKKKHDCAEEALELFYRAQDLIAYIRNPMGHSEEGKTRKRGEKETEAESKILDQAYVLIERYNKQLETFQKLHAMRYKSMALFGKDAANPFDDLSKIVNEMHIAAQMLAHNYLYRQKGMYRNGEREEKLYKDIEKYEAVFWEGSDDNDPIRPRVKQVIEKAEKIFGTVLQLNSA